MVDFLKYSKEYRVEKKLTLQHFLKSAHLTETGRNLLGKTVKEIQIMYDLPCDNGEELIVIGAEITNVDTDEEIRQIAKTIAAAIPQYVVMLLYFGKYCRLFLFRTEENSASPNRRIIVKETSSFLFDAENPEIYMKRFIDRMSSVEIPMLHPRFTIAQWMDLLEDYRRYWKNPYIRDSVFHDESVELRMQKEFDKELRKSRVLIDDTQRNWVEGIAREGDDDYHRGFYEDDWVVMGDR